MQPMITIGELRVVDAKEVTFLIITRRNIPSKFDSPTQSEWWVRAHVAGAIRTAAVAKSEVDAIKLLIEYAGILGLIRIKKRIYAHANSLVALTLHDLQTEAIINPANSGANARFSWLSCMQFRTANGSYAQLYLEGSTGFKFPSHMIPKSKPAVDQSSTNADTTPTEQ